MQLVFLALMVASIVYAFWRGGTAERMVAALYVASFVATIIVSQRAFIGIEYGVFAVDSAMLVLLIAVCAKFPKNWLIWSTAFQLVTVIAHIARLAGPSITPFGYSFLISLLAYPMVILLIWGTRQHRKRRAPGISATSSRP